jgi:hypothetical protein
MHAGQRERRIGLFEPARLPQELGRALLDELHAALFHGAGRGADHGEARAPRAGRRVDPAFEGDGGQRVEALSGEPRVLAFRLGGAESDQMRARIARHTGAQARRVGRVADGGEELQIAQIEHRAMIARAGGNRRGVGCRAGELFGEGRRREAKPPQFGFGRVAIGHPMGDVVEDQSARCGALGSGDHGPNPIKPPRWTKRRVAVS